MSAASSSARGSLAVGAGFCAVFSLYAWAAFVLSFHHDGLIAPRVNAPGADFLVYYHGSEEALARRLGQLFDGPRFTAALNTEFRHWLTGQLPLHPWIYPPNFLLLAAPLALAPLPWSYALAMVATFTMAATALGLGETRSRLFLLAVLLLAPASAANAMAGQNAYLSVALLVGGMRLAERRPSLGGAVLGLMTVKPQLALMIPVALGASRQWRALLWAGIAALALAAASALVFGIEPWRQWLSFALDPADPLRRAWSNLSLRWGLSVESAALMFGASLRLAAAAQAVVIAAAALATALAYRRRNALALPVLLAATLVAAPHDGPYDALLLAIAAALFCRHALATIVRPYDFPLALWVWVAPLCGAPAQGPLGLAVPGAALVLMLVALRRGSAAVEHVVA